MKGEIHSLALRTLSEISLQGTNKGLTKGTRGCDSIGIMRALPGMSLSLSSFSTCTIVQPLRRLRRLPKLRGGFFGGTGGEPFREPFTSFSSGTFRQSLRCAHIKMAALYELCAATCPSPDVPSPDRFKASKTTENSKLRRIQSKI